MLRAAVSGKRKKERVAPILVLNYATSAELNFDWQRAKLIANKMQLIAFSFLESK